MLNAKRWSVTTALLLMVLMTAPLSGQQTAVQSLESQVDDAVSAAMQEQNMIGIAVGLIAEGDVVLFRYYGFERLNRRSGWSLPDSIPSS